MREIAAVLCVSENAIKLHLANLADKFAIQGGIVDERDPDLREFMAEAVQATVVKAIDTRSLHRQLRRVTRSMSSSSPTNPSGALRHERAGQFVDAWTLPILTSSRTPQQGFAPEPSPSALRAP